ncbi:MAG: AbrB/MazE/SpoVT family DNA-binding domain-containing protein [Opitutaceae bacterium]|nr:AbrB/MazE/SpoVT family DNA-binding domain-containing protein [Opitutaceae bacterium]MBP9913098.1 AbrB/MazE/SpoVT family DNA-binding domain-containing protein [Opitutaceae bacterium]
MPTLQGKQPTARRISAQTTISPAFQTTLAAEAVRALGLRPGMMLSQTVEGNRLVLEPLHDVDALAGSLGKGRATVSIEKMTRGAKIALARAGRKGLDA